MTENNFETVDPLASPSIQIFDSSGGALPCEYFQFQRASVQVVPSGNLAGDFPF
jgi:hypothetical protein